MVVKVLLLLLLGLTIIGSNSYTFGFNQGQHNGVAPIVVHLPAGNAITLSTAYYGGSPNYAYSLFFTILGG